MNSLSACFSVGLLFAVTGVSQADTLVPAGTLVQCTISEPSLSSKTVEVGDPILCYTSGAGFGRAILPSGGWLSGHFEDYKDPGHFVGKGWMQLTFDRMVLANTVIPVSAKVVHAPGITVDKRGRIIGHGHAVRDTVEWMIPVLWPMKVVTLPMRGPRPTLKQETRVTLKLMDDMLIPSPVTSAAKLQSNYSYRTAPQQQFRVHPQSAPADSLKPTSRAATAVLIATPPQPARPTEGRSALLILKDGNAYVASAWWLEGSSWLRFVSADGASAVIPVGNLDLAETIAANQRRGVSFAIR